MRFPAALGTMIFAVVIVAAAAGCLEAQSSRLELGTPLAATPQIPPSLRSSDRSARIWRSVMWGAAAGAVAAGVVCASSESCRRDGGVFEDAVFGAALGAAVGGVIGAVAHGHSNYMPNDRALAIGPLVLHPGLQITPTRAAGCRSTFLRPCR